MTQLAAEATALIRETFLNHHDHYGFGSMSCAVYDTAWVALITKEVDGTKTWLFPKSFQYLLQSQDVDGGWGGNSAITTSDKILNTASALLALIRHKAEPLQPTAVDNADLDRRIARAAQALTLMLETWDVSSSMHVGFEMIVPVLLSDLEQTAYVPRFQFPGREALMGLNLKKLAHFNAEALYTKRPSTVLHSLEAFVGKVDFNRLSHHKIRGSMMASPSSTAAYLMNISEWDAEAEDYLRHVISNGPGKGSGSVPSAYPSTNFEFTWVSHLPDIPYYRWSRLILNAQTLSTLLTYGFTVSDLQCPELDRIAELLRRSVLDGSGAIGFAAGLQPDGDDTAKGLLTLSQLSRDESVSGMIDLFEEPGHFRTYPGERDPSFTANCNILLALLHSRDVSHVLSSIVKVTKFLCQEWWETASDLKDKWNLSSLYPTMLVSEAFTKLLSLVDSGVLDKNLFEDNLLDKVCILLFQGCFRCLLRQGEDGSWGSQETTAYATLTLHHARQLCFFGRLQVPLYNAIERAKTALASSGNEELDYLWIEKVTYASPTLSKAYRLAALKAISTPVEGVVGSSLRILSRSPMSMEYAKVLAKTPLFAETPFWQIEASVTEAALFERLLREQRLSVFPRQDMQEDKYFTMIPITWTACNNRCNTQAPAAFLMDMMFLSVLGFQVDEFMESVAAPAFEPDFQGLRDMIDSIFSTLIPSTAEKQVPNSRVAAADRELNSSRNIEVREPLERYVKHVLHHGAVAHASDWDFQALARELSRFLNAHVTQSADNARFKEAIEQEQLEGQVDARSQHSSTDFWQWVHTTSAEHTGCPYAFVFAGCLISASLDKPITKSKPVTKNGLPTTNGCAKSVHRRDIFATAEQKYFAADVCRHLATMCRMYNDWGSADRDRAEANLNSLDFAEFAAAGTGNPKAVLFRLAEYEREALETAFGRLSTSMLTSGNTAARRRASDGLAIWRLFVDVTDLYGQVYVVKDIASRMR